MDLNFIVFPAPKCSYSDGLINGQLLWIPKHQGQENQQKSGQNLQEQNDLIDDKVEFSATKNKNFGSHQSPIDYRKKRSRLSNQSKHFHTQQNFEETYYNDETSNRQFYSVSSLKQFQNQYSPLTNVKTGNKQQTGVIDQNLLSSGESQKQTKNYMYENGEQKYMSSLQQLLEESNKSCHDINQFESDLSSEEEDMQMDCNESDEMNSKISCNVKPDSIAQYSFSKPQTYQASSESSSASTTSSLPKQKEQKIKSSSELTSTQQIKKASTYAPSNDKNNEQQNQPNHIPCLFLNSGNHSPNYLIYFHGNGEDINLSYDLLSHIKNNLEVNVIAMEYPGYGLYETYDESIDKSQLILQDAVYLYDYLTQTLGVEEKNIIILGRSIGSGPATYVAAHRNPGSLVLVSAFTSLRTVASDLVGKFFSYALKERFNNLENIKNVTCPTFIVHGQCDKLISYDHSLRLFQNCGGICQINLPKEMTHIEFDFYEDFSKPLIQFLQKNSFNLYNYLPRYDFSFPESIFQYPNNKNKLKEETEDLYRSKTFNQFESHRVYYSKLKTSCH